jgi:hypothetical protein
MLEIPDIYELDYTNGLYVIERIAIFDEKNIRKIVQTPIAMKIYTKGSVIILSKTRRNMQVIVV